MCVISVETVHKIVSLMFSMWCKAVYVKLLEWHSEKARESKSGTIIEQHKFLSTGLL